MGNGFFNETGPFVALFSQSNPQAFIQFPRFPLKRGSGTPTSHPASNPFSSMQSPTSRPLASLDLPRALGSSQATKGCGR